MGKGLPEGLPPEDRRCVNPSSTSPDGRCRNWTVQQSTQCSYHGNAPAVRSAVARRRAAHMVKVRALKRLEREGYPVIQGPEAVIEVLEERLSVQVAMVRALDTIVRKLNEDNELRYKGPTGEQLRGELQAWLQLNQQVTKLGSDYLKIGLDERRVRIAEAQAQILLAVIQAILNRLELSPSQKKLAALVVPQELERIAIEGKD